MSKIIGHVVLQGHKARLPKGIRITDVVVVDQGSIRTSDKGIRLKRINLLNGINLNYDIDTKLQISAITMIVKSTCVWVVTLGTSLPVDNCSELRLNSM